MIEPSGITKDQRIINIEGHVRGIIQELGLNINDENLKETPHRVAKMYVEELFAGLNAELPKITLFENEYGSQMLVEKDIEVISVCAHHFVPIIGKAHIGYIPNKKVMGLSKFHRIVRYYAARPQLQERLTHQIGSFLTGVLELSEDVMVVINAEHHCCKIRGVRDTNSRTLTSYMSGAFEDAAARQEFFKLLEI